jgi:hypothetical protein
MGKVKSALEIAMEKADKIGSLSDEEKERINDEEKVTTILREFYHGKLDANGLWKQLKGSKPVLLKTAQMNLIDSLGLSMSPMETRDRKKALLAIETLKEKPHTAVLESALNEIEELQKDYEGLKEQVAEDIKRQIEMNPQLLMQPVRTPDGRTVMKMSVSVDEAVKAKLAEFLEEHEKQYNQHFSELIEELKEAIK